MAVNVIDLWTKIISKSWDALSEEECEFLQEVVYKEGYNNAMAAQPAVAAPTAVIPAVTQTPNSKNFSRWLSKNTGTIYTDVFEESCIKYGFKDYNDGFDWARGRCRISDAVNSKITVFTKEEAVRHWWVLGNATATEIAGKSGYSVSSVSAVLKRIRSEEKKND
jgi:hypothetical protein